MRLYILTLALLGLASCGKMVVETKDSKHEVDHNVKGEVKVVLDVGTLKNVYSVECSTEESKALYASSEECESLKIAEFIRSIEQNLNQQ